MAVTVYCDCCRGGYATELAAIKEIFSVYREVDNIAEDDLIRFPKGCPACLEMNGAFHPIIIEQRKMQ